MVTLTNILVLIQNVASCYIPENELTEEQSGKLRNLSYRKCRCYFCRDEGVHGHANRKNNEIELSEKYLAGLFNGKNLERDTGFDFLDLVATTLHETIHILYPEFDEEQTEEKVVDWLKKNSWVKDYEANSLDYRAKFRQAKNEGNVLSKEELRAMGHKQKWLEE
ncbi:MAG: hypothetical protein ABSE15_06050 [Candidatus Bathyarchaeia archaeon]|jgi:hypothetical protein